MSQIKKKKNRKNMLLVLSALLLLIIWKVLNDYPMAVIGIVQIEKPCQSKLFLIVLWNLFAFLRPHFVSYYRKIERRKNCSYHGIDVEYQIVIY